MKDILSYVLFGDHPKYWRLIPLIVMANRLLKPHLIIRYQGAENSLKTPGWRFLEQFEKISGFLELNVVRRPYINHEAAAWRMFPYWKPDIRMLFLRDADSLPCTYELQAEKLFLESDLWVHGMRAHPHHVDDMLASVTTYNCEKLRPLGPKNYEEFAKYGHDHKWSHWAEQLCMRKWFTPFRPKTLISVTNGGSLPSPHPHLGMPIMYPDEKYRDAHISHVNPEMLALCDEISLFPSGQIYANQNSGVPYTDVEHGTKVIGSGNHVIGIRIKLPRIMKRALAIQAPEVQQVAKILNDDKILNEAFLQV